jgi:hypothetical protein
MDSRSALCARCSQPILRSQVRTVYQGINYHQTCFLALVYEEAAEAKARRAESQAPPAEELTRAR